MFKIILIIIALIGLGFNAYLTYQKTKGGVSGEEETKGTGE